MYLLILNPLAVIIIIVLILVLGILIYIFEDSNLNDIYSGFKEIIGLALILVIGIGILLLLYKLIITILN
jgi:hypothetical protein